MQIFQGKSKCLLEQKLKGEGSGSESEERKEEDARGESGVHEKCLKKIQLFSSQGLFLFILQLFVSFSSNVISI